MKIPKPESQGEAAFAFHCKCHGLTPIREYRFAFADLGRNYRADFAWPEEKILAEIEGGTWSNGRHNRALGFEQDCEKYNIAGLLGYRVFRFTTGMVEGGYAIATIKQALEGKCGA
jgi:very-short-patch-repair endonuclease